MTPILFEWKDDKEKPKKEGYYLVVRADAQNPEYLPAVEHFGYQETTKRQWSREFKKEVDVVTKSNEMEWSGSRWDESWVLYWAELPKTPHWKDKRNDMEKLLALKKEIDRLEAQAPRWLINKNGIVQ